MVSPADWASCAIYLRGVDLYNQAYWWESHESFEALWRGAGEGPTADFFQGLIQVAAGELKRFMGNEGAARALTGRGIVRLGGAPSRSWASTCGGSPRRSGRGWRARGRSLRGSCSRCRRGWREGQNAP